MDRAGEWRLIDSDEPDEAQAAIEQSAEPATSAEESTRQPSARWLLALVAMAVIGAAGLAIWLTMPQPDVQLDVGGRVFQVDATTPLASASGPAPSGASTASIVVDVEGAVQRPGLHNLAPEARVGDAIAAAGGYSRSVDIAAAAALLNLAERLVDGAKIHVPTLGEAGAGPGASATGSGPGTAGGLIDVNHATTEELESLPGIGEVTAQEIISAREESAFSSVEDLVGRGVVGPATMDKIRELITVTP